MTGRTRVPWPVLAGLFPAREARAMSERAGRAERIPIAAMGRSGVDRRSGAEFALALARETEASLRHDPRRWKWRRTLEVADSRHPHRRATP
jgi:hypothetical protein